MGLLICIRVGDRLGLRVRGKLDGDTTAALDDPNVTFRRLKPVQFTFILGKHVADTHSDAQSKYPVLQIFANVTFTPASRHCSAVRDVLEDIPTRSILVPFKTLVTTDIRRTADIVLTLQTLNLYNALIEGQPRTGIASQVVACRNGSTQLTVTYSVMRQLPKDVKLIRNKNTGEHTTGS